MSTTELVAELGEDVRGLTGHPQVADLVVEVAESSLRRDLGIKAAIYAEAGMEEYWVVDLPAREVVVHLLPIDGAYTSVRRAAPPEELTACGVTVPLADLFDFVDPFGQV